ncbi:squalene synthase [Malassezia sp. CBS 17886]|nr:squalene synthase [Malassezia sp. CBS 17886]
MGVLSIAKDAFTHPSEARAAVTYKVWRDPVHDIKANPVESGWDRERMRECWAFLDATSRSFAAVIKELKGELSRVICIFYLVLRALDTIEDDMTLCPEVKIPLLVDFFTKLNEPGWNFTGSGPNERDRQLLVEFDKVIAEYQLLNEGCRFVIADICARMGAGMASYIELGDMPGGLMMEKWTDYDLYCHFVAGLVGEGLSGLFAETGVERPIIGLQLALSNHMGLFLQKTNIIRDYAEDVAECRSFWPKECWSRDGMFAKQGDVQRGVVETAPGSNSFKFADSPEGREARAVLSGMLLDAMSHAVLSLEYLILLRDQSVFNFCAIPQVMAIATLDHMFANADVLKKNVKIRKTLAIRLILFAVNPRDVAYTFQSYARSMHKKLRADDVHFVRWCTELSRIEVWCETKFPSYIATATRKDRADVRASMFERWVLDNEQKIRNMRVESGEKNVVMPPSVEFVKKQRAEDKRIVCIVVGVVMFMTLFLSFIAFLGWAIVVCETLRMG